MRFGIGIDIGTTSICGILVDAGSGQVLRSITQANDCFIVTGSPWERLQDPAQILKKSLLVLAELRCENVISIGITGQMHGIVYLNALGEAVSPLYTWQDGRGDLPYENTTYAQYLSCATGYGHVTNFYNELHHLVPKDAAFFCTISDYLAMWLCGKKTPTIHTTNAASFGLFDLKANTFSREFHAPIVSDYALMGTWNNIPVAVAIGDNQASFMGAVDQMGSALFNVGTGSQVSVLTDTAQCIAPVEVRPFIEQKYLLVGSALCGGRSFVLMERFFRDVVFMATGKMPDTLYPAMDKLLETAPLSDLVFHNQFCGTRKCPNLRASIGNIGMDNLTASDFAMGVLQGIATELSDLFATMGVSASSLVGSGNGLRKNKPLQKVFESQFGLALKIPRHKEEASYGAMLFSLIAVGHFSSFCEAQKMIQYEV